MGSPTWITKYGPRRVRVDLPTLEEALYAAEGLTSDTPEQIGIAAELMQLPVDQVRTEAERILKARANRPRIVVQSRQSRPTVVVERRSARRKFA
jgi:hypothetical protein